MQCFDSYSAAFQTAISSKRFSLARLKNLKKNMNIDTSGCYKIFYSISGSKMFHIDNSAYQCVPGDVFLVSPREWHYFSDFSQEEEHERIVIFISPAFLKACGSERSDLSGPFLKAESGSSHKLSLTAKEQECFIGFCERLFRNEGFGADVMEASLLTELMVFLGRTFYSRVKQNGESAHPSTIYSRQVEQVIFYINNHLSEELGIQSLAELFFISPAYLCRIFKTATGTTVHKYITAQRITLAKELLTKGHTSVTVCLECGFKDYSNFLKLFTKAVGVSPKRYVQLTREDSGNTRRG